MQAKLIPLNGSEPIELPREVTIVGRRDDCDIRLDQKAVSKQHCVLVMTRDAVMLRDLGSTNGTRVNGERVRRAAVVSDDTITFANVRYQLSIAMPKKDEPVGIDTRTQHLDPAELDQIMGMLTQTNIPDLDGEPRVQVKTNALPDRYTDDGTASME